MPHAPAGEALLFVYSSLSSRMSALMSCESADARTPARIRSRSASLKGAMAAPLAGSSVAWRWSAERINTSLQSTMDGLVKFGCSPTAISTNDSGARPPYFGAAFTFLHLRGYDREDNIGISIVVSRQDDEVVRLRTREPAVLPIVDGTLTEGKEEREFGDAAHPSTRSAASCSR